MELKLAAVNEGIIFFSEMFGLQPSARESLRLSCTALEEKSKTSLSKQRFEQAT